MQPAVAVRMLIALAGIAVAVAGCGSTALGNRRELVEVPTTAIRLSAAAPLRLQHRRRPALRGPHVGATQTTVSEGSRLTVTVQRLIDPLTGSGAAPLPGFRAVAILVELANAGPTLYDSSATGDFSVVASSGTVTPLFVPRGICQTPVQDFDRYMLPGESRSGCVAFSVASRARILGVRFSPHAHAPGRLTWSP